MPRESPPIIGVETSAAPCGRAATERSILTSGTLVAHSFAPHTLGRSRGALSRIAILSELASRRGGTEHVAQIGTNARELVDVAADIVWSTDPKRDDLGSLLVRLRSFAGDVLEGRGIAWSLDAPSDPERIKLGPDRRRHLYLVLKEAIHNAAKHSAATRVDIAIRHDQDIVGVVRDDGRGFDEAALARRGNGLSNMRARADEAGGTLTIRSQPGTGTEIEFRVA
jgi:signal transduction histidine kinase